MIGVGGGSGSGREHECRGDLVGRERRGQLSASDRLALDAHLEACASCRMARQVYADFRDESAVQVEDAARIERLAAVARRWAQSQGRAAPVRVFNWPLRGQNALRGAALSLVAVLLAGTASGAAWWWRRPPEPPAHGHARAVRVVTHVGPPARAVRHAPAEKPAPPEPEEAPAPPLPAAPVAPAVVARPHVLREGAPSPPALLRQAGEARQRGDAEHAIALYRRLQRDFRESPEAVLSSVPMGGLLLGRRLPRAALAQFDLYLGSAHGGVLIPEALYGRGRALAALGDRQEEARTWQRLLGDFPDSAYTPHAKRRLVELE